MLKELYTAALGMQNQQTRLEVTSNNIANARTTGFKRQSVFERALTEARHNLFNVKGDAEQEDIIAQAFTDFSKGAVERTGNSFDIAIDGEGFFVVSDKEGRQLLTRSGRFTVDPEGMLRTPDGYLLNGFDGPLAVRDTVVVPGAQAEDERPLEITIRDNGEVFVNQQYAGALALVEVSNPQSLLRTGASTFAPTEVTRYTTVAPEEAKVKQGYVEQSNVDIIREMVEMIQLQRGFELGTKVIQTNDGTLDKSIEISRVS